MHLPGVDAAGVGGGEDLGAGVVPAGVGEGGAGAEGGEEGEGGGEGKKLAAKCAGGGQRIRRARRTATML